VAKKLTIRVDEEHEADALAISTSLRDYRLCFELNKQLNINLTKDGAFKVYSPQGLKEAVCYRFQNEEKGGTLYVAANKQDGWSVLPDMKAADFIALANGLNRLLILRDFKAACQQITNIQSTFAIPAEKLKPIEID
jgi:hypothetical protein